MSSGQNLEDLHRRYDGPIPLEERRRAAYGSPEDYDKAIARGQIHWFTAEALKILRRMRARKRAFRSESNEIGENGLDPGLAAIAADLRFYLRERRKWIAYLARLTKAASPNIVETRPTRARSA